MNRKFLQMSLLLMLGVFLSSALMAQSASNYCLRIYMTQGNTIKMDFYGTGKVYVVKGSINTIETESLGSSPDWNGWEEYTAEDDAWIDIYAENLQKIQIKDNNENDGDIQSADFTNIPSSLKDIHVYHSGYITDCQYNGMFSSLPKRNSTSDNRFFITHGTDLTSSAENCNTSIATQKGWGVYKYNDNDPIWFTGNSNNYCGDYMRKITLTVQSWQSIRLNFKADAANTPVRIVSGSKIYNLTVGTGWTGLQDYMSGASTMTIYGNIKWFDCSDNGAKLTGLDVSHNTALTNLHCRDNNLSSLDVSQNRALIWLHCKNSNLSSLDVSHNTALEELWCYNNNLSSLDVSHNTALKLLCCYDNNFSTEALNKLYCSLPNRSGKTAGVIQPIYNLSSSNYSTVMATNKQNAIDKNWKVQYYINDTDIPATTGSYVCGVGEPPAQQTYPLYIAGVQVNENNASDLSVIDGVSGTVSYNHATKTLTLNNAKIITNGEYTYAFENKNIAGLTIKLAGINTIAARFIACEFNVNTKIEGNGSLTATSTESAGMSINPNTELTIKDCSVISSGDWGIGGEYGFQDETLVIDNAMVKAVGDGDNYSIGGLKSLTLKNCAITAPAGAAFDPNSHDVALNGKRVTEQVIIQPTGGSVAVTSVALTPVSVKINAENTRQLTAVVQPSNATNKNVTWSSSDNSVATVDATGLVTAVANGSATITVTTDDGNHTANCVVTVTGGTGVIAVDRVRDLQLYPNPVQDMLYIESSTTIRKIEIFSLVGRLIDVRKVNGNSYRYNAAKLIGGCYMLKITTDKGVYSQKVIKK